MRIRIAVILLIACLCAVSTAQASTPTNRYYDTRAELERLFDDKNPTARYRDPWVNIAKQFAELYKKNPSWNLRPAALYREARAYEGLAQRSFRRTDALKSVDLYLSVAEKFPDHNLADDAVLCAARVHREQLRDNAEAARLLQVLIERYPGGDMAGRAQKELDTLKSGLPGGIAPHHYSASAAQKTQTKPQSQIKNLSQSKTISADRGKSDLSLPQATVSAVDCTSDKRDITISITTDRPVAWRAESFRADSRSGTLPRIVIELPHTRLGKGLIRNKTFSGMLKNVSVVRTQSGAVRITLAVNALCRYQVQPAKAAKKITVLASSRTQALPKGKHAGESMHALYPVTASKPVLNPKKVPANLAMHLGLGVRTIVLDAGHGGSDPGALGNRLVEKNVNLDMTKRIAALLKKRGFTVRTTRDKDVRVALEKRTAFANKVSGDLFISIHVNANENKKVSGFETYYLDFARSDSAARVAAVENAVSTRRLGDMESMLADIMLNARTGESENLAECIQKSVLKAVKGAKFTIRDGGVRPAPLHVLMGSGMPGVLIEIGYCSNASEARRLADDKYRNSIAAGIAKGIEQYTVSLSKS